MGKLSDIRIAVVDKEKLSSTAFFRRILWQSAFSPFWTTLIYTFTIKLFNFFKRYIALRFEENYEAFLVSQKFRAYITIKKECFILSMTIKF